MFENEQVWIGSEGTKIGDSRFVPLPASMVRDLMFDWEKFVNAPTDMPPLIQCALMHYQVETILPFLDGNGRIDRLLITLFLYAKKILPAPLLYFSGYFERDRNLYYNQLFGLRATGDWEQWSRYFLRGYDRTGQRCSSSSEANEGAAGEIPTCFAGTEGIGERTEHDRGIVRIACNYNANSSQGDRRRSSWSTWDPREAG